MMNESFEDESNDSDENDDDQKSLPWSINSQMNKLNLNWTNNKASRPFACLEDEPSKSMMSTSIEQQLGKQHCKRQ